MYESYYGLAEKPFSGSPDPRFLFPCGIHQAAFEVLEHAWQRGEGVVAITGDAGTGKTTLCRTMLERFDRRTFGALVVDPMLSDDELLKLMLQDFGVVSRDEFTRGETRYVSTQALFDTLSDFLLSLRPLGASAVLIVDEAQNLRPRVLDQIRILSNLEVDKKKLLEVVLVGRPTRPRRRGPAPLAPWVSITHELRPLSRVEAAAYVRHRVAIASGGASAGEARVVFQPQALYAIHRLSDGIPQAINLLCDRALTAGCAGGSRVIDPLLVRRAAESLDLPRSIRSAPPLLTRLRRRVASAAMASGLSAIIGATGVGLR